MCVWSSLRNTWSKCEILEIAEEGTKVCKIAAKSSVSKCLLNCLGNLPNFELENPTEQQISYPHSP